MTARSEQLVTLIDGRQVSSWSEEWRHECEARAVLALPSLAMRRAFLYGTMNRWGTMVGGVKARRGDAEVKRLEKTMMTIYRANKRAANDNKNKSPDLFT